MNWIIRNTEKLYCHTNLNDLLNSSWINISEFNWVMSDLDVINFSKEQLPIDLKDDYSIITPENLKKIVKTDSQIIWGVISAVKKTEEPIFDIKNPPFAEGNDDVWINDKFQVKNSSCEITAWDSSFTIVKFKDGELSKKFKAYFDEAIELEEFNF
ncbi:hypothetical protein [Flavobacterium chungangense]|uniref:Uncharacterized protein n=1 Tax=Flavobacterium chungangense TaxID=554283 RepID=A0A6V6Z4Q2_9FLAO|nr:hypothetical protein [Flavobacterium chungangense]CAD0006770.1 hypothetical protein FLACHUCJ7_02997 [Flavobacterium chungangense]